MLRDHTEADGMLSLVVISSASLRLVQCYIYVLYEMISSSSEKVSDECFPVVSISGCLMSTLYIDETCDISYTPGVHIHDTYQQDDSA